MKKKHEMLAEIIGKANEDEGFRERLLSDAKSAISDEFEIVLPEAVNIVVHEGDGKTYHMTVPPKPRVLEEGQLARFTGGSCIDCFCG